MPQKDTQNFLYRLFSLDSTEILKLIVGGLLFFAIIGSYTLIQELKYGIFSIIVGTYYIPAAKLLAFAVLLPAIMLDGYLVDYFKRYQLVILYTFIFGAIGILFTFLFTHPEIGIGNTKQDIGRIFGWMFFLYAEAFAPFLLGVFWAFMNSIHNPKNAQKTYAFITSASKIGGISTTLFAYFFLSNYGIFSTNLDGATKLQLIVLFSSLLLLSASLFLALIIKKLNLDTFKGYHTTIDETSKKTGIWKGISLLLKNRYVLSIFLLVLLADIIAEVVNYKRILIVVESKTTGGELHHIVAKLYLQLLYMHLVGLCISLFLTNSAMRFLGTRVCVFIMPVFTLIFATTYVITSIDSVIVWLYIIIKAMHYTIGTPVRESLYIITSKDIQFKAKFVIDALGIKLARNSGQALNYTANIMGKYCGQFSSMLFTNVIFIIIPIAWIIISYFVGNIYSKNLKESKVIS